MNSTEALLIGLNPVTEALQYFQIDDQGRVGPAPMSLKNLGSDAGRIFDSYSADAATSTWQNTCGTNITIGVTSVTQSLANERPRYETYTRKCVLGASTAEIRFASANFTADPTEKALCFDLYIESQISEFLASNPYLTVQISNTTALGSNYSRWVFDAGYLRQGWNQIKMRQADTVSATSGAGNLPTGCNHPADVGTGFDWSSAGQFMSLTFSNMNGMTVHVDMLRKPAKAKPILVMGFDSSGSGSTDEVFNTKVAPLFAQYGMKGYCTMTNIYELIFAGTQAWRRMMDLYANYSWDIINHTWSHGGTEIGRVITATTLSRTSNVCTFTFSGGHGLKQNRTCKLAIVGATPSDMNGIFDCTVTGANTFTYTANGADGSATGTVKAYSYLSEVLASNTTENQRLLKHEVGDIVRVLRANAIERALSFVAYPNNLPPEQTLMEAVYPELRIRLGRGYRGGYTFVNEFGIDNPLNFGSYVMDSGTNYTRTSDLAAKIQGAVDRGDHIQIFGHFILDDTDPANAAYAPVAADYPPSQGGNPAPPGGVSLSGYGGWWYYSQLRDLVVNTIAPLVRTGRLRVMSPSEYAEHMGMNP